MQQLFKYIAKLNILHTSIITAVLGGILLLGCSYLGYVFPWMNWALFWLICATVLVMTMIKTENGLFILFFELFIGAKGYLFSFPIGDFVISLRLALFVIVLGVWILKKISFKQERARLKQLFGSSFFIPFLGLMGALVMGLIVGVFNNHSASLIFFDMNAYVYWLLLLPVLDTIITSDQIERLVRLFLAGAIILSLATIFIFADFYFFHQDARPDLASNISSELAINKDDPDDAGKISQSTTAKEELKQSVFKREKALGRENVPFVYRWLQDTGTGEISYLTGKFFRVFFVSDIYIMLACLFLWMVLLSSPQWISKKQRQIIWILFILFAATTVLSFSRSLWLGLGAGIVFSLFHIPFKKLLRVSAIGISLLLLGGVLLNAFAPSTFNASKDRILSITQPTNEKAATNRINLLAPVQEKINRHPIIGNGFGTTVEYESVTPEKQGTLRVYLVEWTYLDIIMKMGIVGFFAYSILIVFIFREGYRFLKQLISIGPKEKNILKEIHITEYNKLKESRNVIVMSFLVALFGFLIVNITTPYLNHPLGIGFLVLVIACIHAWFLEMQTVNNQTYEHSR